MREGIAQLRQGQGLEAARIHAELQHRMFGHERPSQTLGRFTVHERIGQGAMGEVYRAHDPELDRQVALKLLRWGAGPDEEPRRRRIRREARAMARLTHPNVVTVHEFGEFEGQGYLVMELVEGVDLRHWLDEQRPWREVVEVFVAAGHGLAAAHRSGLIHRDFKPGNVLLGDDGRVLVADFGLAGLAAEASTEGPAVLGTPAYMSPEQWEGDADPRSDQYAYCVALYEALHGHRPGTEGAATSSSPWPTALDAALRRGLARDREARFESMDALLEAIAQALRPSRHGRWLGLGFATLALAGGTWWLGSSDSPLEACRARQRHWDETWTTARSEGLEARLRSDAPARADEVLEATTRALEGYGQAWTAELDDACRATHVDGVQSSAALQSRLTCLDQRLEALGVQLDVLAESLPDAASRATLAVQQLAPASSCRDETSSSASETSSPQTEALQQQIYRARALSAAGRPAEALTVLEREPADGFEPDARLSARLHEARAIALLDEADFESARTELIAAIGAAERADDLRTRARGMVLLAELLGYRLADADAGLEWATLATPVVGKMDDSDVLHAELHRARGNILFTRGHYDDAQQQHELALQRALRVYPEADARIGALRVTMATTLRELGRTEEARDQLEQARAQYGRVLGASHPRVGLVHNNLATVELAEARFERSAEHARTALEIFGRSRSPTHPDVAMASNSLGTALASMGDLEGAVAPFERAVEVWTRSLGPEHPRVGNGLGNLALVLSALERFPESLAASRRALEIQLAALGPEHPDVALVRLAIGRTLLEMGEPAVAVDELHAAHDTLVAALGPNHAQLVPILVNLGTASLALDRFDAAVEASRRCIEVLEASGGAPVQRVLCEVDLGKAMWLLGEAPDQAIAQLRRARELSKTVPWRDDPIDRVTPWARAHGVPLDAE
ncbi:MAG: serine/threonine-protein kinase [Myxococcota bacterium]